MSRQKFQHNIEISAVCQLDQEHLDYKYFDYKIGQNELISFNSLKYNRGFGVLGFWGFGV